MNDEPRFFGWRMVSLAALAQGAALGLTLSIYGLFVPALLEEFSLSSTAATAGVPLAVLIGACVRPFVGRLSDRGWIRLLLSVGAGTMAAGFLVMGIATAFWQLAVAFLVLVTLGREALGFVPANTLVANWFSKRRGRAFGIAASGMAVAGIACPPAVAALIVEFGWQGALTGVGLIFGGIILPAVWIWAVGRPEDIGQNVDGARGSAAGGAAKAVAQRPVLREVVRSRDFWGIAISVYLVMGFVVAFVTHLPSHAQSLGIGPEDAAWVLSCMSLVAVPGTLGAGWMADRIDPRWTLRLMLVIAALGWIALGVSHSFAGLMVAGGLLGFSSGGLSPARNSLIGRCFERDVFGGVLGLMTPLTLPIFIAPVPLAAAIRDATGSFEPAFQAALGATVLSVLATALIRLPAAGGPAPPAA